MPLINVDKAISDLKKAFSNLSKEEIQKGTASAINRSISFGNAEGRRQIRQVYNIPQSVLMKSFQNHNAKASLLIGEIRASSKGISLANFQPTFSFTQKSKTSYNKKGVGVSKLLKGSSDVFGKGVTVQILKGQTKSIPYAFMIPSKRAVFARGKYQSGGKYDFIQRHVRNNKQGFDNPIKGLERISVYSSLVNDKVMPVSSEKIKEKFAERLKHEFKFRINKISSVD